MIEYEKSVPAKRMLLPVNASTGLIKGEASLTPDPGMVPAYSASGQDVWVPRVLARAHGPGIVLSAVGARCGKVFFADHESWGTVANTASWRISPTWDPAFVHYVLDREGFWIRGGSAQPYVQVGPSLAQPVALIPLQRQRQIVHFLNQETRQIDRLINKQERLIELLAEKRQAIITQAVTKGLDPSVPTKPSDIPFMGEVPASWKVSRLGTWILRNIEGGYSPSASTEYPEDGEWGVLALGAVGRAEFFGGKVKGVDLDVEVPKNLTVRQGDILLTRSNVRDRVGFAAVVDQARPRTIFPDLIYRLHVSDSVDAEYLVLFLSSQPSRAQIMSNARGSSDTMPKISHDQIRSWQIPLPPVTMQREIVRHVQKDLSRTDELSRRAVTAIDLLKERRSALISAAVTGKIDVREGAA